jgi:diacylglycerol kinase
MGNLSRIDFKKLIGSFGYAWTGIKDLVKFEQNARVHLIVSILVIITGFVLELSRLEWCIIIICIGMVFSAEAFNTVIEKLVDHLFTEKHETARLAKDVAAGAVLLTAIASVICGFLILGPKLLAWVQ